MAKFPEIPLFLFDLFQSLFYLPILHKHKNSNYLQRLLLSKCPQNLNESSPGILPRLKLNAADAAAAFQPEILCLHGVNFCFSSHIFNNNFLNYL
jgi:hypothetical protein